MATRWRLSLFTLILVARPVIAASAAFPLMYSVDRHYLVDQTGAPFPVLGRAAWGVVTATVNDYRQFLDDSVARGFNSIEFPVVSHDYVSIPAAPFGGNHELPFLKSLNGASWSGSLNYGSIDRQAPDFTTPNEAYWRFIDTLLADCEARGLVVFMFPAYFGYKAGPEGWAQEMVANGPNRMHVYGAWIAERYRNQRNLVWLMGGDWGTGLQLFTTPQEQVENGLFSGLKSVGRQQSTLFSAEWGDPSVATDQASFGRFMTLNGVYNHTGD